MLVKDLLRVLNQTEELVISVGSDNDEIFHGSFSQFLLMDNDIRYRIYFSEVDSASVYLIDYYEASNGYITDISIKELYK